MKNTKKRWSTYMKERLDWSIPVSIGFFFGAWTLAGAVNNCTFGIILMCEPLILVLFYTLLWIALHILIYFGIWYTVFSREKKGLK